MLIVLAGLSGAGKDTTFRLMRDLLSHALVNVKFVEPFKLMLSQYLGVTLEQLEDREWRTTVIDDLGVSPLDLMVKGFEVMPQLHPRLGLHYTKRQVASYLERGQVPVFTDMRNPVEAEYLKSLATTEALYLFQVQRSIATALETDKYLGVNIKTLSRVAAHHGIIMNYGTYGGLLTTIANQLITAGLMQ